MSSSDSPSSAQKERKKAGGKGKKGKKPEKPEKKEEGESAVVKHQPGAEVPPPPGGPVWMDKPKKEKGVPPGLEYLSTVDHIIVEQLIDLLEVVSNWECANTYLLMNKNGQKVYFAMEESNLLGRQIAGNKREFTMHFVDNMNVEVMRMFRPYKIMGFAECEVEAPVGTVIARMKQEFACCHEEFVINDADGKTVFRVVGPGCCDCSDVFKVNAMNGEQIGAITKIYGGYVKETFTNADTFAVDFPMDLDVKMKAALLAAALFIDFMVFEEKK